VDNETYRRARIKAAERETSVSALVRQFLVDLTNDNDRFEQLERLEQVLREQITNFDASDRLSRDEVHERKRRS
jgi:hypothetical protein